MAPRSITFPIPAFQLPKIAVVRWFARFAATGVLWFGAGCASLPDAHLLKRHYSHQFAEFKSAWGPIPTKTSAAIMAELKRKSGNIDILDRQITIEQTITGQSLVLGNKVTLLQDGPATYQAMFAAIRTAKDNINVESYIIEDGEVGQEFADLLLERQAAGVQVNVIYDSFGAYKTKKEFFDRLRDGGIQVVEFNPINPLSAWRHWRINHRDHRKLLIVDGRTAFLGGINIDSVYSTGSGSGSGTSGGGGKKRQLKSGWRDTDIEINGPVVADFQRLFIQTWEKQHGPSLGQRAYFPTVPPQGSEIVRANGSTPDDPYNTIYLTFLAAIANAQKQIYITNAYFVPDHQLVDALIAAARRGIDVRLLLPSTTDSRSAAYAAHSYYNELLKGGVKIFERRSALLHAKTAVVDGVWSCIGSSNLDWRSALDNDEITAIILSRDFAQQMLAAYAQDEAKSDPILLANWRHRRISERCKEWFFHLCARLL